MVIETFRVWSCTHCGEYYQLLNRGTSSEVSRRCAKSVRLIAQFGRLSSSTTCLTRHSEAANTEGVMCITNHPAEPACAA